MVNLEENTGFNFENCRRNAHLAKCKDIIIPKARKTGTTIVGLTFKDGVILGADTRATEGPIVADKNCSKIHYIAPNIYCCGAGTAADTERTTLMISSEMELLRLNTGREVRVVAAATRLKRYLFGYRGYISAALVLGGVDRTGSYLYQIYPNGSCGRLPYVTMGSGSLAAMSVFESHFRPDMELDEAKQLVSDAVSSGIFNDLGSGTNVDVCVITKDKVDYIRPFITPNPKGERLNIYKYKKGSTAVLKEFTEKIERIPLEVTDEYMDES